MPISQGVELDLSLPDESLLTGYMNLPDPGLPGDRDTWRDLFDTFLVKCKHHHDLLLLGQAEQLFDRFLLEPDTLKADEMALVLSILGLGRQAETQLRQGSDKGDIEQAVAFYKLGLSALASCEQASQTGMRESLFAPFHCLDTG